MLTDIICEKNQTLSKSPETISEMFNRIAKTYDFLNDCMTAGLHRQWKKTACSVLQLQPGDQVLDVCTGTGDLAYCLSQIVGEQGHVVGVDFSPEMLAIAKQRFSTCANVKWLQGNALSLPFEDNCFDGAVISFGLRNVESVEQALREMIRVTRPGSWIVNLDTASNCKNPLFWLYFSMVMPLLGKFLAKDYRAYQYLCRSTETFLKPVQIELLFQQLGLQQTIVRSFGLGSVSMQAGLKP